jgi:hypothetical protein
MMIDARSAYCSKYQQYSTLLEMTSRMLPCLLGSRNNAKHFFEFSFFLPFSFEKEKGPGDEDA